MKSMLGARLLNCLLNESVKDAPIPLTAIKRALPDITIKIVNMVLSFLSQDSNEKMKVSLIFIHQYRHRAEIDTFKNTNQFFLLFSSMPDLVWPFS
jgi:hypothetical protein